jgi:hypothetical protein
MQGIPGRAWRRGGKELRQRRRMPPRAILRVLARVVRQGQPARPLPSEARALRERLLAGLRLRREGLRERLRGARRGRGPGCDGRLQRADRRLRTVRTPLLRRADVVLRDLPQRRLRAAHGLLLQAAAAELRCSRGRRRADVRLLPGRDAVPLLLRAPPDGAGGDDGLSPHVPGDEATGRVTAGLRLRRSLVKTRDQRLEHAENLLCVALPRDG